MNKKEQRNKNVLIFMLLLSIFILISCKGASYDIVKKKQSATINESLIKQLEATWIATNYGYQTYEIVLDGKHLFLNNEKLFIEATEKDTVQTLDLTDNEFHYDFKLVDNQLTIYRWFPDKAGSVGGGGIQPIELVRKEK